MILHFDRCLIGLKSKTGKNCSVKISVEALLSNRSLYLNGHFQTLHFSVNSLIGWRLHATRCKQTEELTQD